MCSSSGQLAGIAHATHVWGLTSIGEPLVSIKRFRMDFAGKPVVEDLSFDVKRGETLGFLGSGCEARLRDEPEREFSWRCGRWCIDAAICGTGSLYRSGSATAPSNATFRVAAIEASSFSALSLADPGSAR